MLSGDDQIQTLQPSQVADDDNFTKSERTEAEAAEDKQKRQLKEMKREEYRFYKVKMLATIGITIVTYIVFFCLIKYLPGDGDATNNQDGIAPE